MTTTENDIILPEILLYGQHHDEYNKRSIKDNITDLSYFEHDNNGLQILSLFTSPELVARFREIFNIMRGSVIKYDVAIDDRYLTGSQKFLFILNGDNFVIKKNTGQTIIYIAHKDGESFTTSNATQIVRFFNKNNKSGLTSHIFDYPVEEIYKYIVQEMCGIDIKTFCYALTYYQATKDLTKIKNGNCIPNGIVLEILLEKLRTLCETHNEFREYNDQLKQLWFDITKKYYSSPNLGLPESLDMTTEVSTITENIKFKYDHTMLSLDNELKVLNELSENVLKLKLIFESNVNDANCKSYCDELINLLVAGSELLIKFKENNINYWLILTRIAKIPIKIYEAVLNGSDVSLCLSKEAGYRLARNFGKWVDAISSSSIIHIYKYAYYLLMYKLFSCNEMLKHENITTHEHSMLEEFVSDCNLTQIYDTTMIDDINIIKLAIIKLKPMWFSTTNQYKSLLGNLYNIIQADNGLIVKSKSESEPDLRLPISSDIMFKQFFASNVECFNLTEQSLTSVGCSDNILKTGHISSTFNETEPSGEVIIAKNVRFSRIAIEANKHKIITEPMCSAFYFPNLDDVKFSESTCYSILLQIINTCRLKKLTQNNYPYCFAGDCMLRPTQDTFNLADKYLTYDVDITVYEKYPIDYVDTSVNISGVHTVEENDDSIYNFIKYLQTNDQKYLQYAFCFVKYGYSLGFTDFKKSYERILKYSADQQTLLKQDKQFMDNSLFINTDQLASLYSLMDNEENFINVVNDKLQHGALDKLTYNLFLFISLNLLKENNKVLESCDPQKLFTLEELSRLRSETNGISEHNLLCVLSNAIKYYAITKQIEKLNSYFVYLNNVIDKKHETYNYSRPKVIKRSQMCSVNETVHYLKFPLPELQSNFDVNKKPSGGKGNRTNGKKVSRAPDKTIKPSRYRYGDLVYSHKFKTGSQLIDPAYALPPTNLLTTTIKRLGDITNDISEDTVINEITGFDYGSFLVEPAWKLIDMDRYDAKENTIEQVEQTNPVEFYKINGEYEEAEEAEDQVGGGGKEGEKKSGSSGSWGRNTGDEKSSSFSSWGNRGTGDRKDSGFGNRGTGDNWRGQSGSTGFKQSISRDRDNCGSQFVVCMPDFLIDTGLTTEQTKDILQSLIRENGENNDFKKLVKDFVEDRAGRNVNVTHEEAIRQFNLLITFGLSDREKLVDTERKNQLELKNNYLYSLRRTIKRMSTQKKPSAVSAQVPVPASIASSATLMFDETTCGILKRLDEKAYDKVADGIAQSYIDSTRQHISVKPVVLEKFKILHQNYVMENRDFINNLSRAEYGDYLNGLLRVFDTKIKAGEIKWVKLMSKTPKFFYYPKTELKRPLKILENLNYKSDMIHNLISNNEALLQVMHSLGEEAYIRDYNHYVTKMAMQQPVNYDHQAFSGTHQHELFTYSLEYAKETENYTNTTLSVLFMNSIGLFLESHGCVINIYNIDGFYYDDKIKQYVKHCINSTSKPKNIYLTQNIIEGQTQVLIDMNDLATSKTPTSRSITYDNENINISVYDIELEITKLCKINTIDIFNKQFDNEVNKSTVQNAYIIGYLDDAHNVNIYTPFHIPNKHITNSYNWFNNIGTISTYPHYTLEYKDRNVLKQDTKEKFVSIIDVLTNSKFSGMIEILLHMADSIDDMLIWEKDGQLSSIDFIKAQTNFKFIGDKVIINDEYTISDRNNWILQRWTANVPNLLMVQDKYNNYFIYVLPIGQNPYISNKPARQTFENCATTRLEVLIGNKTYAPKVKLQTQAVAKRIDYTDFLKDKLSIQKSKVKISGSIENSEYHDIIKLLIKKNTKTISDSTPQLAQELKNIYNLYDDIETIEDKIVEILLYYTRGDLLESVYEKELIDYGIFLYNTYHAEEGTTVAKISTADNLKEKEELKTYLLYQKVLTNITDRMESVKFANMFRDNFDNIERYSDEIAKQYLLKINPQVEQPLSTDIQKYGIIVCEVVKKYKQLLIGKTELTEEQKNLEATIYSYVRKHFGLSTNSEKIIKFNMITLMPIINNRQTLEQLCLSYLNFNEIGNIYELSDTIRKLNLDLNDYILSSIKSCFNYGELEKCEQLQRFRLPSFARIQSSLAKNVHNMGKSYNVEYTYDNTVDMHIEHDALIRDYYFPEDYTYIMPTFCEYFLYSLLNKDKRNRTFSMLIQKMKQISLSYASDVKAEFDLIIQSIENPEKKYKTNPLEFFYQCLAGFFAREKQQELANNIIDDICEKRIVMQTGGYKLFSNMIQIDPDIEHSSKTDKTGRIHTLIMGGGKTKMITPLVILKYLQQISLYHLKMALTGQENSEAVGNHMYLILPENLVHQSYEHLVMMNMYFPISVSKLDESREAFAHFASSTKDKNDLEMKLFIMSDTTMKCGILNDKDFSIKANTNKHCYLFDEVDTILDPIISELNYPDVRTETALRGIDKFYDVVYEILYDIFVENPPEIKQLLAQHVDEFLTTPHFYLKKKARLAIELQNYARNKCIDSFRLHEKIKKGLEDISTIDKTYLDSLDDENISILIALHNFISEALPASLTLRNRHHYGLSDTIPKKQKEIFPIIVPFSYAEKPRDDSSFSNPLLVMVLTTIDYLVQNKPKPLPNIIIDHMISHVNTILQEYPSEYKKYNNIYNEYMRLSLSVPHENIKNTKGLTQDDINKLRHSKLFIKLICQHNCSKYIKFSTLQENISGLDLVMSNNTTYRSGFTGTPNIPNFVDMYIDRALTIASELPDLSGQTTNDKINATILKSNIAFADDNNSVIEYITNVLSTHLDHTVLIDAGAVLVGTTPQMIFDIVKTLKPDLQQFIYWNNKDHPITRNKDGKELLWTGSMTNNMFYYYDNMHTTGIDAQIDENAKGIVLLGSTSRYRDVAQGMYRMRKLHVGQTITFVVNKKIKHDVNQQGLLEWFNSDERSYLESQQRLMNSQNILALSRYESPPSYELNNAFSYPNAGTLENLRIITGEESLRHNYIVQSREKLLTSLDRTDNKINYQKISDINVEKVSGTGSISMSLQQEIEQVKELAQNYEKRQNKALVEFQGNQYLISNITIADYYNKDNVMYYDPKIQNYVYIAKNLKYYSSPYMITYSADRFFILPFGEGYKLFNTYIEKEFTSEFPADVLFIDSNGIGYNKHDLNIQTLALFLARSIDETIYISLQDYMKLFTIIKSGNTVAQNLLETITNDKSTNNIFKLFSNAILIYSKHVEEINGMITHFNGLNVDERKQYYATLSEDFKPVFSFQTLDGKLIDKLIDF